MLSDAVIQAIADQVQAGFVAASSTCKVLSYWPNPLDQVWLSGNTIVPWLVLTAGDEYDELLADGLRGTASPRLDRLFGRYHLLGVADQGNTPSAQSLQQQSRADKALFVTFFAQGVGASVGGSVIEAARIIQIKNPSGGPYDPTNKSRAQLTWDAYISIMAHVHL